MSCEAYWREEATGAEPFACARARSRRWICRGVRFFLFGIGLFDFEDFAGAIFFAGAAFFAAGVSIFSIVLFFGA